MTEKTRPVQITIVIEGDGISTATPGIEAVTDGIATAEPAPERFSGFDADAVVRDATSAPARFQPSDR